MRNFRPMLRIIPGRGVQAAVALLALLGLGGCSSSPQPDPNLVSGMVATAEGMKSVGTELDTLPESLNIPGVPAGTECVITRDEASQRSFLTAGPGLSAEADRIQFTDSGKTLDLNGNVIMTITKPNGARTQLKTESMLIAMPTSAAPAAAAPAAPSTID